MSPSNEKARLAALRRYAVLDTPPEEPFDRITRVAAQLFDVPIALIALVDEERQWFKSRVGLDDVDTVREVSFCAHNIRTDGVMVVDDATTDDRFADNPLVTGEPGIRFYAGAPLTTPDGYHIGTVCVIDTEPRELDDPGSRAILQDLAQMAMDQIERRITQPRYADILESISDAFFALNDDWQFTYLNEQAEDLLLRTRDELLGRNVWEEFPEAVELEFYEQYHRAARTGESVQFEAYFPPLETWFRVNAYPFSGGLSVYFDDITERVQIEQTLREREEYLAVTLRSIGDAVIATDEEGHVTEMNSIAERLTGWSLDEAAGRLLTDIFHIENAKTGAPVKSPIEKVLHEGQIVGLANHTMLIARDGTQRQIADSAAPIRTADGDLLGVVMVFRDVTEQYQQEEALSEERRRLELALTGGDLGLWDLNYNTGENLVNDRWAEMLGLALDDVEPTYEFFEARVHPEDRSLVTRAMIEHVHGEAPIMEAEIRMRHADGSWRWILDRGKVLEWNEDGSPRRAVGTHLNITERKEQMQALRERTIALEQAQFITKTGSGTIDLTRNTISLSEEAGRLLGLDPSVEQPISVFMELVHPDDIALVQQEFERVRAGKPHDEEYRIIPAGSDTVRWLRGQGHPEVDETGTVTRVFSTIADITERKEREQALRESRQLLKESQRIAHLGHWDWNVETGAIYWSDETYRIFGYEPGAFEPTRETYFEAIPEPDRQRIEALNRKSVETGAMELAEHRIVRPDGSERVVELTGVILERDDEAAPVRVVGTVLDITERKEREEELRRQRDLLEQTQRLAGAWEYDLESDRIGWSEEVYRIHEVPLGASIHVEDGIRFYAPEAQPILREAVERAVEAGESWDLELPLITAQGNWRWVRTVGAPIRDAGGEVVKLTGAFQDITERRTAEEALRESEGRYRTLVERSHDAIYIYRGMRLLFVNNRACELTGYSEDELLTMNVFDLIHPDDRERVRGYARQRARGAAPSHYEARIQRKDGRVRYADFSVQAITYQGEHAVIGSIRDVTERRVVEEALRESEQRFRALAEETTDVVTRHAPDGTYLYVSPSARDVLGYAPDDLTGTLFPSLIHPNDLERVEAHVAAAQREGEKVQFEYRIRHADGHYVWVETAGQHVVGDEGTATLVASTRSVTERKAVEQALMRREKRVEALYEAMRGLTEARTREQVAEHILTLIDNTLGYSISGVRYRTDDNVLVLAAITPQGQALMPDRPNYDLAEESLVAQAHRRGETVHSDDVQALDLAYDLGAVRAAAYVPIGAYGTISVGSSQAGAIDKFDLQLIEILARNAAGVLERIDREDALRAARDKAEEMSRLKSAFLANMSHEIRTPLTSIIGFSEVLGEQELGGAGKFATLIQQGGQRLLETLNSVLDLSQLEAGSMHLAPEQINVAYEVQAATSFFAPKAQQEGIDLRVDRPEVPVEANLDAAAVRRILNNLLSNAVKFTIEGGRIDVRLKAKPEHLVIEVEDTGIGIDEDFLPHLFDAFRQESTGSARSFEGSGLGLAITHQLVQLMGGTIGVVTEKGSGTCFTVKLPYHISS